MNTFQKACESNDDILSGDSSTYPVSTELEAIGNKEKESDSVRIFFFKFRLIKSSKKISGI